MRLLFVTDLHYALKQFDWLVSRARDFSVVVIGGDLLDLGSYLDFDVQIVVVEKYLARLQEQTRVIVCSGNHDGDRRNEAGESIATWLQRIRSERLHVDFDHIECNGTLITVCPWWDGPVSRAELETFLAAGAARVKDRWIWIHHAPPDPFRVSWTGKRFAGDANLTALIRRFSPDVVLSGHIHNAPFYAPEGSWIDRVERTWVINPGRQTGPQPAFVIFDLVSMRAEWVALDEQCTQDLV